MLATQASAAALELQDMGHALAQNVEKKTGRFMASTALTNTTRTRMTRNSRLDICVTLRRSPDIFSGFWST